MKDIIYTVGNHQFVVKAGFRLSLDSRSNGRAIYLQWVKVSANNKKIRACKLLGILDECTQEIIDTAIESAIIQTELEKYSVFVVPEKCTESKLFSGVKLPAFLSEQSLDTNPILNMHYVQNGVLKRKRLRIRPADKNHYLRTVERLVNFAVEQVRLGNTIYRLNAKKNVLGKRKVCVKNQPRHFTRYPEVKLPGGIYEQKVVNTLYIKYFTLDGVAESCHWCTLNKTQKQIEDMVKEMVEMQHTLHLNGHRIYGYIKSGGERPLLKFPSIVVPNWIKEIRHGNELRFKYTRNDIARWATARIGLKSEDEVKLIVETLYERAKNLIGHGWLIAGKFDN